MPETIPNEPLELRLGQAREAPLETGAEERSREGREIERLRNRASGDMPRSTRR
jgi:hypothetical protein